MPTKRDNTPLFLGIVAVLIALLMLVVSTGAQKPPHTPIVSVVPFTHKGHDYLVIYVKGQPIDAIHEANCESEDY